MKITWSWNPWERFIKRLQGNPNAQTNEEILARMLWGLVLLVACPGLLIITILISIVTNQ